jgi:hypothetical protein
MKRLRRLRWLIVALPVLCLAALGLSALSNLGLPTRSPVVERLSDLDKARLLEVEHLRGALGDDVWPGWGQADIPIIVHNEEYAFLVGYPDPPDGWLKMPQRTPYGGPWEPAPGDTLEGAPYYRQRLAGGRTPQSFTVLVGERWVATLLTRDYAEVSFYAEMRDALPPGVREVPPYRLAWQLIMGETDNYLVALEHEAFHAFQGARAPERLAAAENANALESRYPWDDRANEDAWGREAALLVQAVRAPSDDEARALARQYLAARDERTARLDADLVDYERQREWLEGLAKYAELAIGQAALDTPGYAPVPALAADPAFQHYRNRKTWWAGQIDEVQRTAGRPGETRFYYSGMAQALLLDRLSPGWKARAFEPGAMLEDLLREAVR